MSTRILAIDPATQCGWAQSLDGHVSPELSGTWDLSVKRNEGAGMRFVRLGRMLSEFEPLPELVVFEDVAKMRSPGGAQVRHIYGGITSIVMKWCEEKEIPYTSVPIASIKKHATGKGNAKKDLMVAAARERWGPIVRDDNQADALWLLDYALTEIVPR